MTLLLVLPTRLSAFFLTRTGVCIQGPRLIGQRQSDAVSVGQLRMSVQASGSEESRNRRQLLFTMLTAASGASVGPAASRAEQPNKALKMLDAMEDWSNVEILKPPTDDRDYLAYVLRNGLKVVICSDPTSIEAGAAIDVHVGACSDPIEVPGLAHFNEHMLFLGTKKYPKEDSFEEFLSANGGASNAYTASEDTVYHFTLQAEADAKLEEGLDRFGSFFTSPLFTASATGRELNAIESENAKNLQSDNFRIYQIEKGRQNSAHPHSKFFTGNKATLLDNTKREGLDLRNELITFYNKYYSANQMTLAVVGPQPIDTLKRMVEKGFGGIPNRNVSQPEKAWQGIIAPYGGTSVIPSFGHVVKVVPVQDLRQISVTWPIIYRGDADRNDALLIKQANYAAHLIGHEGPGSLLSYLKKQGWVNSVTASSESELSDFETFEVTIGLTKRGLDYMDNIVEAVFSYIKMIRNKGIPRFVFFEVLQLEELQWRFSSKREVSGYVQSLATSLQKYPPSLCVAGRRLALTEGEGKLEGSSSPRSAFSSESQFDYTRKRCEEFSDYLTVDNAMVTVMAKSFQGQTNQKEKWYGTDFRVDPIPVATLNKWRSCADVKQLGIDFPKSNPFIPSEEGLSIKYPPVPFDRFKKRSFEERMTHIPPPAVIRDDGTNGRWTVYYKPDNRFGQPKAFLVFQLLNNKVFSSAKNAALANFYEFCISDKLGEYAYDAELAGLTYDVRVVPRGVRLTFGGYSDKLQKFATYVSRKISIDSADILPSNHAEFERYKDIISRTYAAFDVKQPYAHCASFSLLAMTPSTFDYSNQEMRKATDEASLEDLRLYVSSVWSSGKGLALVQGNLFEEEALSLVTTIDKALRFKSIESDEFPPELTPLPLPPISSTSMPTKLAISEPNPENSNSASYIVIQDLSEDPKDHVMIELVASIVSEKFYEELRTKQQLGYIVSSGIRSLGKSRFLGFIVQSSVAKNDKLTSEILKYLDNVRPKLLEKLPKGDLAVYVKSLIDRKTEPDKQLATEVTRNWGEIGSGRLQFDRIQQEIGALLDVTKDDLLEFWDRIYVNDGRRVLATEMVPRVGLASTASPPRTTGYSEAGVDPQGDGPVLGIDDIVTFRTERQILS
eukprot:CAMPEP_0116996806 /NCGR_PEP_ID=MMETSP0472-20121206/483_1 /TAXON_ID=693140 ORGANISM="Tiarina fusus, Strain LIS" /NCGR_SAMPLE_ID=MMETSP0472 /ASSEMBLY_ACC=CAM_ASM_000603 /LENGTH=1123 /DNA_ID=CAMNT_0004695537 /DNA_START=168 /DNA_END=3539 /DNA_ORIENTATION=-